MPWRDEEDAIEWGKWLWRGFLMLVALCVLPAACSDSLETFSALLVVEIGVLAQLAVWGFVFWLAAAWFG